MSKGFVATNLRCEDAERLARIVEALQAKTQWRVTKVEVLSEALKAYERLVS